MTYQDQLFLKKHQYYEVKFAKSFARVLEYNYRQIARNLENEVSLDEIDSEPMQKLYRRLYMHVMSVEAPLIWNELVAPLNGEEIKTKDIFDEVASMFAPQSVGQMRGFWSGLMSGFLDMYVIQRVSEVMKTTVKRASEFIERQRNGGLTNKEIARMLRADARVRELRANTIARTEVTNAISKSQILALESSKLNWEKSWNAIRDERTRQDHWDTSPTLWISIKDNFIIGGFPMAYPGDDTQGSPIKECINCRCYLKYRLAGRTYGFRPKR